MPAATSDTPTMTTQRSRGRPTTGGPVVTGSRNGHGIAWCDGQFAGEPALVADVRAAIASGQRIWLARAVDAGPDTPAQATAALLAAGVSVVRAPEPLLAAAHAWTTSPLGAEAGHVPTQG